SCPSASPADWKGIKIDADGSHFTDSSLLYASSGIQIANAKLDLSGATLTGIGGTALSSTGPELLTVTCSSIRGNGTGIAAENGSVSQSDVYNNSVANVDGNANLHADYDWLGPVGSQKATGANVTNARAAQRPTATLSFTGDNELGSADEFNNPAFGIGHLTLGSAFNRQMSVLPVPAA